MYARGSESSPDSINKPYGAGNPCRADSPINPYGEGLRIYADDNGQGADLLQAVEGNDAVETVVIG